MIPQTQNILACLMAASANYDIPPAILYGIMEIEGGKTGIASKNTNGSYDLGLMQINTLWLPELAAHWKLSEKETAYLIANDTCTNLNVASWILRKKINEAEGSLIKGIAYYHSKTPNLGKKYATKVYNLLKKEKMIATR